MQLMHKIRLRPGVNATVFERWVRQTDYATCPFLPSVQSFAVLRATGEEDFDYIEIIQLVDEALFEKDMGTARFKALEKDFYAMAEIVGEIRLELVQPGYSAPWDDHKYEH